MAECACYRVLLGDPLARFKASAAIATKLPFGYDPDTGIGGIRFFTWPVLENLVFSRAFGLYLFALLVSGIAAWKTLAKEQRILFAAVFLTWAWLGYGTTVPWTYKPFYRQVHVYGFAVFGICAVAGDDELRLCRAPEAGLGSRCRSGGGASLRLRHWGALAQSTRVSRQLLRYAQEHRDQEFVTNVSTMNCMYALGGFQLPQNVVCVNGPAVEKHLLVNKEPPGTRRFHFPETAADGCWSISTFPTAPRRSSYGTWAAHRENTSALPRCDIGPFSGCRASAQRGRRSSHLMTS